jgi:hypothetical protein
LFLVIVKPGMMRILLFIFLAVFISCNKEEFKKHRYELVGKWKRIEVYVNPGNGGSWQPDRSKQPVTLEFTADGKLISNDNFYSNFSSYHLNSDNSIEFQPPLNGALRAVYYSFNSDTELTLTFACIEGCGDRFVRY